MRANSDNNISLKYYWIYFVQTDLYLMEIKSKDIKPSIRLIIEIMIPLVHYGSAIAIAGSWRDTIQADWTILGTGLPITLPANAEKEPLTKVGWGFIAMFNCDSDSKTVLTVSSGHC